MKGNAAFRSIICLLFFVGWISDVSAQIERPIGTNLSGIRDWSEEFVFVDVFKQSREWIAHEYGGGAPWSSGVAIPLGANGYPLEIPYDNGVDPLQAIRTLLFCGELQGLFPAGNYRLMASGTGTISIWGGASGTFQCPVDTVIFFDNTSGCNAIEIDTSDVNDPIHDIRFIMPGHHLTYQTDPFHPKLLEFVEDFQVLRFMDWMNTNNSPVGTWQDRNPPDYYTQTLSNGVSYESIIEFCNIAQKNPWICIPHMADSNYIVQIAQLFRDSLDPGLKIYVEYSNEVWNGIFAQHQYAADQGLLLGYTGQPWERGWKYTAKRSADIFKIFEDVFVDDSRFVKIIPAWVNSWVTNYLIERFNEPLYNPYGVEADAVAIAPYFAGGIADDIANAGLASTITVSDILDSMQLSLTTAFQHMDECKVVADTHGLDLFAYEGGQHLVTYTALQNDTSYVNKLLATNRDSRIQSMYCEYFDHWFDSTSAGLFCNFSSHGNWGRYGSWGVKEHYDDTLSEKYQAMQNCAFAFNAIDSPDAIDDVDTLLMNTSVCLDPRVNDIDINGDSLQIVGIWQMPANGSVTFTSDSLCYTPDSGYFGIDILWYEVCDYGCPPLCDRAVVLFHVWPTTKIDEIIEVETWKLYPNPSESGLFTIASSSEVNIHGVYSMLGREIPFAATQVVAGQTQVAIDPSMKQAIIRFFLGDKVHHARIITGF